MSRHELPEELADVRAGRLPVRYGYRLQDLFYVRCSPLLAPGVRILDIGAGRRPAIPRDDRPPGIWYVALDRSADELRAAPTGTYDDVLVHDIATPLKVDVPFDLALSWQVLEHVGELGRALENIRNLLRPDGRLLAQLSGSNAVFSVLARWLPHRVRVAAMSRWLGHGREEKFPLGRHRRTADELTNLLAPWTACEIIPFYRGATYLSPVPVLQRAYLRYESAVARRDVRNLATHYLIVAQR